jgi:hypothetical protein
MNLLDQRCSNHSLREAAVQCPSCKRYFCRECVTEHQGRMICVSCVTIHGAASPRPAFKPGWILTSAAGLLIAWLIFYYLGQSLTRIPLEFHANPELSAAKLWRTHSCVPRRHSCRRPEEPTA